MLATKDKIYTMLTTNVALLALVGGADHIVSAWGETIEIFPLVIYQDENQSDMEFADNKPMASSVRYRIDVFTTTDLASTTEIGQAIAIVMMADFFTCGTNGEVFEVTEGVKHRVMRFSRELFTSDIL